MIRPLLRWKTRSITGANADPAFQAGDNAVTVDLADTSDVQSLSVNLKIDLAQ